MNEKIAKAAWEKLLKSFKFPVGLLQPKGQRFGEEEQISSYW